jgi:hypothetical protein
LHGFALSELKMAPLRRRAGGVLQKSLARWKDGRAQLGLNRVDSRDP